MSTLDDVFEKSLFVVSKEDPETDALIEWMDSHSLHMETNTQDCMQPLTTIQAPVYEELYSSKNVSYGSDGTVSSG
jgi:hypothetical protein